MLFTRIPIRCSFRNADVGAVVVTALLVVIRIAIVITDSNNRKINNEITQINKNCFSPHVLMKVLNMVLPDQRQDFRYESVMKSRI